MNEVICKIEGELDYNKSKSIAGDYAHNYGNITFSTRNKTELDKILSRLGTEKGLPKYYKGKINSAAICSDIGSPLFEEIHDCNDLGYVNEASSGKAPEKGDELIVYNNKWMKNVIFHKIMDGTFHKWETVNGFFMVLSKKEVDMLNEKERKYLRV